MRKRDANRKASRSCRRLRLQTPCVTVEVAPERLIEVLTRKSLPPHYEKGTAVHYQLASVADHVLSGL